MRSLHPPLCSHCGSGERGEPFARPSSTSFSSASALAFPGAFGDASFAAVSCDGLQGCARKEDGVGETQDGSSRSLGFPSSVLSTSAASSSEPSVTSSVFSVSSSFASLASSSSSAFSSRSSTTDPTDLPPLFDEDRDFPVRGDGGFSLESTEGAAGAAASPSSRVSSPPSPANLLSPSSGASPLRQSEGAAEETRFPKSVVQTLALSALDRSAFDIGGEERSRTRAEVRADLTPGAGEREAALYSFDFERLLDEEAGAPPEGEEAFLQMLRSVDSEREEESLGGQPEECGKRPSAFLSESEDEDWSARRDAYTRESRSFITAFPLSSPTRHFTPASSVALAGTDRRAAREALETRAVPNAVSAASRALPRPPSSCSSVSSSSSSAFLDSRVRSQVAPAPADFDAAVDADGGTPQGAAFFRGLGYEQDVEMSGSPPRKKANTQQGEEKFLMKKRHTRSTPALSVLPFSSQTAAPPERLRASPCVFPRQGLSRRYASLASSCSSPFCSSAVYPLSSPTSSRSLVEDVAFSLRRVPLASTRSAPSSVSQRRREGVDFSLGASCVSSPDSPASACTSCCVFPRVAVPNARCDAFSAPPSSSATCLSSLCPNSISSGVLAAERRGRGDSEARVDVRTGEDEEADHLSVSSLRRGRKERGSAASDAASTCRVSSFFASPDLAHSSGPRASLSSRRQESGGDLPSSAFCTSLSFFTSSTLADFQRGCFFSPSLPAPFGELRNATQTPQKCNAFSPALRGKAESPCTALLRESSSVLSGRSGKRMRPRESPRASTALSTAAAPAGEEDGSDLRVSPSFQAALPLLEETPAPWPSSRLAEAAAASPPAGDFEAKEASSWGATVRRLKTLRFQSPRTPMHVDFLRDAGKGLSVDDASSPLAALDSANLHEASSSGVSSRVRLSGSLALCGAQREEVSWASLPQEALALVCEFLSFKELAAFQRLDKRARAVASHRSVWRSLCANEWVVAREGGSDMRDATSAPAEESQDTVSETKNGGGEAQRVDDSRALAEASESTSGAASREENAQDRAGFERSWQRLVRGEEEEEIKEAVKTRERLLATGGRDAFRRSLDALWRHRRGDKKSAVSFSSVALEVTREAHKEEGEEATRSAREARRVFWLNAGAYKNDFRRLYRDGNGWFPHQPRESDAQSGARKGNEEDLWRGAPRFTTAKMKLNPHLSNSMDTREDAKEILIASEGVATPGGERSSYIRVIDRESLSVVREQQIPTRSLNCLDICPELYACGDDSGTIRLYSRRTHSLLHRYTSVGVVNMMAMYGLSPSQEVNDLRICRTEQQIVSVRTASRYPAGIEVVDLHTGKGTAITPEKTNGNWIHALDVEQDLALDFPAFAAPNRKSVLFAADAPSSYSPPWRRSSITSLVAVSESSSAGCFSLLRLDLRCARPVVQEIPQTRRMLWPLRVHGANVFVNSVFAANELCGRIRQIDLRAPSPDVRSQQHSCAAGMSEEGSKRAGACMVHWLPTRKVEDIRVMGEFLYVLTDDADGCLQLLRFDTKREGRAQVLTTIDVFDSSEWSEPLRLLQVNPHGWTCTYGNYVKFGRIADPEDVARQTCGEVSLASPLSLSAFDQAP
ncbi:hypothetical protein BESB_084810 [Besnoitia besnoiti]|uniref:F-box domain-containing protein n=1 Tax=Besnoitia besnoiti TaxID=94643 RepID=A0A2A9MD24_BESBE|nr:hypothetical protein BESB_084810 [Besnoitia besnoiti]PFH33282.1 hypothetical protein BESB_084810 [Besnoitia besnoiti]